MTELEQIKEDVINAESNAQSARIRLEEYEQGLAAQELPEVWYLGSSPVIGWHYSAGESVGEYWDEYTASDDSCCERRAMLEYESVTQAVYDNAKALYHGADFTGRLDQIGVPVCELNKATRDEMFALPWSDFGSVGAVGCGKCFGHRSFGETWADNKNTHTIYRLRAPKMRTMTRKEVLAWASSADAFGWVVRTERLMGDYYPPQCVTYGASVDSYQRAQIATLNDDGTGGEWEAFEVAV